MHIPDGYLSPASCAIAYGVALPFWLIACRRLKRRLHTRLLPQLALFSAFCFVLMMFNLPLPGGTTGHAVGMAIAAIVLGPWAALLAVSVALLIQAVFFGDGGITTLGANCLNMAIVGSFVAYGSYRLLAGRSAPDALRRVFAAGIAGYLGINASALLAAIEFGIQPLFFHDAAGTPLYAPYPLSVAVPAMMIGHLGPAGIAELVVSAGLVAYLRRSSPELLGGMHPEPAVARKTPRGLWYALAVLMIASPLGLVAAGTAWGEWGVDAFQDAAARQAIRHASANIAPPSQAPAGLARLAEFWTAPLPDYAPAFMHSETFGYVLSAFVGVGIILLAYLLISRFAGGPRRALDPYR
jgi:cobalt/nickel transport system permease protein